MRRVEAVAALVAGLMALPGNGRAAPAPVPKLTGTVTIALDRVVNRFRPISALGAGIDGQRLTDLDGIYTRRNVRAMRSAGLGPLTYRLRTELAVEAWHFNPIGRWSDARREQGYWTSSSRPGPRVAVSYGYRLPRRGDTVDQANDDGYSRLDDGASRSFWKSNPYLDPRYTGRDRGLHPQWAMVDLGRPLPIDAVRIDWGLPYATRFAVEYWVGRNAFTEATLGYWQMFPLGPFHGHRGSQTVTVARRPLRARFVRLLLTSSSHTAARGSVDVRDRLGYAVRELYIGRAVQGGLQDVIRHAPSHRQTLVYVSSTDPWHRARDIDPNVAEPGFDRVFASGLTNRRPLLLPVAMLYGTPADAAAELRFLRARHYPVGRVELGEEPDNQLITPEDYGALYVRFARALHRVDPRLVLGGPSFATSIPEWEYWPDANRNTSFVNRFLGYLRSHGARNELSFFSFEWYPFDDVCAPPATQLVRAPDLLANQLLGLRRAGLPTRLPKIITEYGYSSFAGEAEADLPGALLNADLVGTFLALGGSGAYLYGYEPSPLLRESSACDSWGNLALLQSDPGHRILHPLATYHAARLLTRRWTQPGGRVHLMYSATSDVRNAAGEALVTAYALRRPDGRLAVMLINKDPTRSASIRLRLSTGRSSRAPSGAIQLYQLSRAQYRWHPLGEHGYPRPDRAPAYRLVRAGAELTLRPYSLSVVRIEGRS